MSGSGECRRAEMGGGSGGENMSESDVTYELAEKLAALTAENARLRGELARLHSERCLLTADLARVTAERDGLREQVKRLKADDPARPPRLDKLTATECILLRGELETTKNAAKRLEQEVLPLARPVRRAEQTQMPMTGTDGK